MPQQLKQNKADKVHLGHGFGIFYIQSSNICDPKSYFSKKVIFLTESVAWLCAFPLKDCNIFEKSAVMVWNGPSMRIQFHKSMAPSANRFQQHFKLRSTYIYTYIYIHIYIHIYIYTYIYIPWCSFVIMAFFEVNVYNMYNYLEYIPSRKCIISLKRVQDFLRHQNIIPNFKMEFFCVYSVPFYQKSMIFPEKMWKALFSLKATSSLREMQHSLKTMELYSNMWSFYICSTLSEIICPLVHKWWNHLMKKSAQLFHIEYRN